MTPKKLLRLTWLSAVILLCASPLANAATYFTRIAGVSPWNVANTWSTVGFGGAAAGVPPGAGDVVNIGTGSTVTITAAAFALSITVDPGGTLQLGDGDLTVTTTTVVNGIVTTVAPHSGLKTFGGLVTVGAAGNWDLSAQNPATSFAAGITNNGAFNNGSGTATFTANQNLAGVAGMTFGTLAPNAGITVTNTNTFVITVNGGITLTGNFTQGNNSSLQLAGPTPFTGVGTFNATTNPNTVSYTGGAQTVRPVTYRSLTLTGTGVKTMTGVTTIQTNFIMSGSATATTVITTISGGTSIQGTAVWTTGANTAIGGNLAIGATAGLTLGGFSLTVGGATSISGAVTTTSGVGTKSFGGMVTINAGATWLLSNNPPTSFSGGITMNGASFDNGTGNATFLATQQLLGASNMTFGGQMILNGGVTLTNNNTATVTVTATGSINTSGTFTQGTNSTLVLLATTPVTGAGTFNGGTNVNTVNYNGTAQNVRAGTYSTLNLNTSGVKTMPAGVIVNANFNTTGTVDATGTGACSFANVTLGTGTTFTPGAFTHTVSGNWTNNNAAFVNAGSTIAFNGTTQTVGGTNPTTFNNVSVTSGTTTFPLILTCVGNFNVNEGGIANFGGLTTHTASTLSLRGSGQGAGTYGGTGSGAAFIFPTFFAAASGLITVAATSTQSLPFIEPFSGEADGATSNVTPPWRVTQAPSGVFEKESPIILLGDDGFEINNTGAVEGVWQTADLDIGAGVAEVAVSLDITAFGTNAATDYVRVYYVWDVGPVSSETLIATVTTATASPLVFLPATGHTKFRLVIRGRDQTAGSFIAPFDFTIDNINIIGIRNLYSRATAAWNASGTWSTVGINGADCACTPSAQGYDRIFVGGARTVTLAGASGASRITVNGTADAGGAGTLNLSTFPLTVTLGGSVTANTGGTISSSAGSSVIFNDSHNHTITANGSITIGGLDVTNASLYGAAMTTIGGAGTMNITGDVEETMAFIFGTLTVQNNMPALTIGGVATLNLLTEFVNNGTVTMTSTGDAITGIATWTQNPNSTLNYAGATMSVAAFDAAASGNTVNYNGAGAQAINNVTYWHLSLSTSGTKTADGNISVQGNWNRSGTAVFNGNGDLVTFNAPATGATQTITAVGGETFSDLRFNSSLATAPQITLNNNVTVSTHLTMSAGVVNLNTHILSLTATSALSHSLASTAGWVYNGTMTRAYQAGAITIGTVDGLLPLGTASYFKPFFIGKNSILDSNGTISLTHTDPATTTTGLSIPDTGPAVNIIIRDNAVWGSTLTPGAGVSSFNVRYGGNGTGVVANLAHLRSMLLNSVIGTHVAASGSLTNPRVERSGLTPAQMTNNFYIGSSDAASSLPVTLASFDGVAKSFGVELTWRTLTELNNDFFTVLHSKTGLGNDFTPIGTVPGNGTTNEPHTYSLIDYKAVVGKNYYMLRQTDLDGKSAAREAIVVERTELGTYVSVYPNPLSGHKVLNVVVGGLQPQESAELNVVDTRGMTVRRAIGVADEAGTIAVSLDFTGHTPGLYILKVLDTQFKFAIE